MISLWYPDVPFPHYYVDIDGFCCGPFGSTGMKSRSLMEFRLSSDELVQGSTIYHERDVWNVQTDAELEYSLVADQVSAVPTATYPDRVSLRYLNGTLRYYSKGMGGNYACSRGIVTSSSYEPWAIEYPSPNVVITHRLYYDRANEVVTAYDKYTYTVNGTGTQASWFREKYVAYFGYASPASVDWSTSQTYESLIEDASRVIATRDVVHTTSSGTKTLSRYGLDKPLLNLQVLKNIASAWALTTLKDVPPESVDYGLLAMKASEHVNATDINVIAFLRDLRRPQELIPKLQNLKNLKTWANNYLTVKYGILPTISDVNSIIASIEKIRAEMKNLRPYNTYSAGNVSTLRTGLNSVRREQHVKLAIANGEGGLSALCRGFERIGVFPNLKSIWDLLPYSFCVDWLVDVGDYLARIDLRLRLMRYSILYSVLSDKITTIKVARVAANSPISGSCQTRTYHRWTSGQCPLPSLTSLNSQTAPSSHWLEAAALLVQRKTTG